MKILILHLISVILLIGCKESVNEPTKQNDFSFYFVTNIENNNPYKVSIENLELEENPFLNLKNITSYDWLDHKIEFTDEAKVNIQSQEPLYGRYFVTKVEGESIYWGKFTFHISSASCNNPVIIVASTHGMDTSYINNSFIIARAYPSYLGNDNDPDLRADIRIDLLQNKDYLKFQ
jgi:hypothetical protein